MARLPRDFDNRMGLRNFAEQGRGYGGDYGEYGGGRSGGYGAIGGMRSDAGDTNWRDFPGEEGWFGEGYAGYPGGEPSDAYGGGYDRGLRAGRGYGADFRFRGGSFGGGGQQQGWGDQSGGGGAYRGQQQQGGRRGGQGDAGRVRASSIMTENPETVTPDTTVVDAARKMRELDVGIIPVVESQENRRLKGVVTDRDLAIRVLAEGKDGSARVSECMTTQVETVNKNDSVLDVFDVMKREQVRRVPVTDRENRLVGIISQADLAVYYAGLDLQRETEVEEVIERISEPARPQRRARAAAGGNR
ncbi:MAG: CBS domain-containing protein [Gemmatimonadota bacterium]|nr:CBS domain-containing protein [Gemmatimonadota bacterium]